MQELLDDSDLTRHFCESLSPLRFARYLEETNGDEKAAVTLYHWNSRIASALYIPLQVWEITLRNRLHNFLCWKYGPDWPRDERRALKQLKPHHKRAVAEATTRQSQKRGSSLTPDAIVADLSIGFWVGLLSRDYEIPFSWRYNLPRIFPKESTLERASGFDLCQDLADLRNRVAHHEPVHNQPLAERHGQINRLLKAMNEGAHRFSVLASDFEAVWAQRPKAG
jgi:hypothetical protein